MAKDALMDFDEALERYEPVLGFEVHVELNTETKMFSAAANPAHERNHGAAPNTLVAPVDMGLPGSLPVVNEQAVRAARALYEGDGKGAALASSRGTAWGLLNSVTEYVDHHRRASSSDHRRDAAWFGRGAQFKQRAWDALVQLTD